MHDKTRLVLSSGLSALEVGERLRRAVDGIGLRKRELAFYLFEMHERCLYIESGHCDVGHFAAAQLDMPRRRAREYVQLGRALGNLELLDDAFCGHELSWSKVLALLPVIQRETQAAWVEHAKDRSFRQLRDDVAGCRPGQLPDEGGGYGLVRRLTSLNTKLPDTVHAKLERIQELMSEDSDRGVSEAQMIELIADAWLKQHGEPTDYETENAPHNDVDHNDEELPDDLREDILRRDGHRCGNCSSHLQVQVHHIQFRSQGGNHHRSNLITLCKTCHACVHRNFLKLQGNPESHTLIFTSPDGTPIVRGVRPPPAAIVHEGP